MKILSKAIGTVYRFRCNNCRSAFEIDEDEKEQIDWEFTDEYFKEKDEDLPLKDRFKCNGDHKFHCPVCNAVRWVYKSDWHVFQIMEDGTEYQKY